MWMNWFRIYNSELFHLVTAHMNLFLHLFSEITHAFRSQFYMIDTLFSVYPFRYRFCWAWNHASTMKATLESSAESRKCFCPFLSSRSFFSLSHSLPLSRSLPLPPSLSLYTHTLVIISENIFQQLFSITIKNIANVKSSPPPSHIGIHVTSAIVKGERVSPFSVPLSSPLSMQHEIPFAVEVPTSNR